MNMIRLTGFCGAAPLPNQQCVRPLPWAPSGLRHPASACGAAVHCSWIGRRLVATPGRAANYCTRLHTRRHRRAQIASNLTFFELRAMMTSFRPPNATGDANDMLAQLDAGRLTSGVRPMANMSDRPFWCAAWCGRRACSLSAAVALHALLWRLHQLPNHTYPHTHTQHLTHTRTQLPRLPNASVSNVTWKDAYVGVPIGRNVFASIYGTGSVEYSAAGNSWSKVQCFAAYGLDPNNNEFVVSSDIGGVACSKEDFKGAFGRFYLMLGACEWT